MDRTCLVSVRPTSVWTWQTNSPLSAEDTAVMLNSDPDGLKDPVTEYRESFFSRLGPADRTFRILLLNCNSCFQHFIILRTVMMVIFKRVFPCSKNWIEQDGPSSESSSYLNVSLRYLGPWDLGTPGPWKPLILGLLDLFPPPIPPHTSPYILLPPPISSSYSPPLVWFG